MSSVVPYKALKEEGDRGFGRARARGVRSRAQIPFPFPLERLPRRLALQGSFSLKIAIGNRRFTKKSLKCR